MSDAVTPEVVLSAHGVTHRFGDVVALEDLNVTVARGELLVILGASGCGKSTLLNLFAGFAAPTRGEIRLTGRPVTGVEPRCGMVFQQYALFDWLTVAGNVAFGPRMRGVGADERRALVERLVGLVGLRGFEQSYPGQLSGGMRQRVALARTLANDPEVLLCDEPFAALDALTRSALQAELARIVTEEGKTCVFITHSIDEALVLADRVIVLSSRPGRVLAELPVALPRPRDVAVQATEAFQRLRQTVWECVRDEV